MRPIRRRRSGATTSLPCAVDRRPERPPRPDDRAGKTFFTSVFAPVLASAAPAASAAASTAARTPIAIRALVAAGEGRLLVGLVFLASAIVGGAGFDRLGHRGLHHIVGIVAG